MSPEQARGMAVDKRADIWAFGCVLFEMLSGRRPFDGEDATETLAAVVKSEPEWEALPGGLPPTARLFLRRCLHKDPRQRVGDIRDVRLALEGAFEMAAAPGAMAPSAHWRERAAWSAAFVCLAALAATLAAPYVRPRTAAAEMRVEVTTPATTDPVSFAMSPDGQRLVFVATNNGQSQLWLRSLDAVSAQPLAGTEGAAYPFWSPDSRSVGFFAEGKLKRIDVGGGPARTLVNAPPRGGTWNSDGVILCTPTAQGRLFRVSASGGEAVGATTMEAGQVSHRFPHFLPGGRQFLFYSRGRRTQQASTSVRSTLRQPCA
jgi:hypothetical protein